MPIATLNLSRGDNRTESFLRKNPLGFLPVLELDDGRILCESLAICRYLEELHPEPNLMGENPYDRANIERWTRHVEMELQKPIADGFRMRHPMWKGRIDQVPEYAAVARARAEKTMRWLDKELSTRPFIAGDRLTIADITALCAVDFGPILDVRLSDSLPHLAAWHQRMTARPSVTAAPVTRREAAPAQRRKHA